MSFLRFLARRLQGAHQTWTGAHHFTDGTMYQSGVPNLLLTLHEGKEKKQMMKKPIMKRPASMDAEAEGDAETEEHMVTMKALEDGGKKDEDLEAAEAVAEVA